MAENSYLKESTIKRVEWSIQNFSDLPTEDDYQIESPRFSFCGAKWFLRIYPNGETKAGTAGLVGLYLFKEASAVQYAVAYSLGIKKTNGSDFKMFSREGSYPLKRLGFGTDSLSKRSTLQCWEDSLTPNGTLTFFCTTIIKDQWPKTSNMEAASQTVLHDDITNLSKDLKDLYLSKRFTDVTVKVKNREFLAHRNILASRSEVFASMFLHDTEEKKSGRVEIPDCDPDSFEYFIMFLYTGKLNEVTFNNAVSLYKTSEKYDVQEMKEECVRRMIQALTLDTFCDVIHLATMYCDPVLLKAATDFFNNNTKDILMIPKWRTFISENPLIGNELFLNTFTK